MKKIINILGGLLIVVLLHAQEYKQLPMWNTDLSMEKRVNDLVGRLTLEEKVAQMLNTAPAVPRMGIPAYDWWNEILHGVARTPYKTTVYPQAIGMAATWDTAALQLMARYSAMEGRAINNLAVAEGKTGEGYKGLTYWTPNINIFRDPRWGRGQETYGEDPFLTAKLGAAFVRGLQGNDSKYLLAAACAKHFAVHSGPEYSRHTDDFAPTPYDLWDTYLPAFRELVVNAKVAGVMCAYNALYGQPCCGNDLLMNDILRNQWKFTGYVTSDCWAIDDFVGRHKTHKTNLSAAVDAVSHGTDVECGNTVYRTLVDAVKSGQIPEQQIDISLKRLFRIRYRLGMFDPADKVPFAQLPMSTLEAPEHKALALKMARESIVLLKNDGLLPLGKKMKRIAVIGPNADNRNALLGNYNGVPSHIVSVLEGIKEKVGSGTEVVYQQAINYTDDTLLVDGSNRKADMEAIAQQAATADAIIYVGGISPELEGEEMSVKAAGFSGGDRTSIMLPAVQTTLLKHLKAIGKPVVFVMLTGSAIAIPEEQKELPAILNAWYGGQSAGTAIADVLFGDYNPAGRLPVTFYKDDASLPDFKNYGMEGRTYRYYGREVLYPFGWGLSYTTFRYSDLKIPVSMTKGKALPVSAVVSNTGKDEGDEVVQLYLSYRGVKGRTPLRALKGFQRIHLKKGESRIVRFILKPEDLQLVDDVGKRYAPTGKLEISVGGGQPVQSIAGTTNVVKGTILVL